jgi:hypothetical protein
MQVTVVVIVVYSSSGDMRHTAVRFSCQPELGPLDMEV